jgi:type III restriction enzyme
VKQAAWNEREGAPAVADRIIENPIINSPYKVPDKHFRFDDEGITSEVVPGRRPSQYFVPVPKPRKKGQQLELDFAEFTADKIRLNVLVNQVRDRVDLWRKQGYQSVTPTTRRLLEHWSDPQRDNPILFAQREAAETAIYLAEAAQRQGDAWIRNQLNETNTACNLTLHRVALKMATGSGKTVVMAMLIAWQTLNKVAQPTDGRFAKRFLVITPGLTIRDRLRVLLPEDDQNYYKLRGLAPADLQGGLGEAKITIVNYHQLQRRETRQGKTVGSLTKELLAGTSGGPSPFQESWGQMVARVTRDLGGTSGIVVFNDEAHHCYLDRYDNPEDDGITDKDLAGDAKDEAKKNTEAARLWFNGLRAINERLGGKGETGGVKAVYDLSATPSFLSGSGYKEGTLFPWVVSDFSLVEAIESGIVKIPRVPVDDNATTPNVQFLHLWPGIKDALPKKGRKAGEVTPDQIPGLLEGALNALYESYAKSFAAWETSDAKKHGEPAPVFIVVCNNTTVSKMVYDYIAGWEKPLSDYQSVWAPGKLPLFSNIDHGKPIARPRTILVDSLQFESGEGLSPEFKKIAAAEIEEFRAEYARRVPGRKAEDIDDGQIMREVMNTVGKAGKLGEPVRCVVSVSMLTEGWDANTVTHILGVRAFGTQLLCEQVVGRGLRRRSYEPDENGLFTPEYADVYGVPFAFMPTVGKDRDRVIKPTRSVHALPERKATEITFPRVAGYRLEIRDPELFEEFTERSRLTLDTEHIPTQTVVGGLIGVSEAHTLDDLRAKRDQEIAFALTHRLMQQFDHERDPRPWYFPQLLRITKRWLAECVTYQGDTFPGLLLLAENADLAAHRILYESISRQEHKFAEIIPIFRQGDQTGSTATVDFITTKEVISTGEKCHVNYVVLDGIGGNLWEKSVAEILEQLPQAAAYVKNDRLGFTIPYSMQGRSHEYIPDFLVRLKPLDAADHVRTLIVEVSGTLKKEAPTREKADTTRNLWIPGIHHHGGFGRWGYTELRDPKTFRANLVTAIEALYNDPSEFAREGASSHATA